MALPGNLGGLLRLAGTLIVWGLGPAHAAPSPDDSIKAPLAAVESALAEIPSTPAGRAFAHWLDAFNSGDSLRLQEFIRRYASSVTVTSQLRLFDASRGFDLVRIVSNEPLVLRALLRERDSGTVVLREIAVTGDTPPRLDKLSIRLPPPDVMPRQALGDAELLAEIGRYAAKRTAKGAFSGVVLLARGDKLLLHKAWGDARRDTRTPNEPDSGFRIGSMNKMFTAVATLQLVASGNLSLDDPVGKVLTDYPDETTARSVTIRHLLTHTGGTGDFFGYEFDAHRLTLQAHADYLALFGHRRNPTPGTGFSYSNYGFILLGAIIERASGQPYEDYVRDHILRPAGMTGTGTLPEEQIGSRLTVGYMRSGISNADILPWSGTAAGGGYSTAGDLWRFAQALRAGSLLSRTLLDEATRGTSLSDGQYGQGFMLGGEQPGEWYGHSGGFPGMNGMLRIYPASGVVLVVLSNLDPPSADILANFISARLPLALRPSQ